MNRVVVTGMGMVSPLGHCVNSSWKSLLDHQSGIQSILNDPVLKNDKAYNLSLVKEFDFKKWRVPVTNTTFSMLLPDLLPF